MISFPQAKINLGLNIVERRPDGYHNLETVFYPVPLCDALELQPMSPYFPSCGDCDIKVTGISVEGNEQNNLVVKAYNMLKAEFPSIDRMHAHLHKAIPTQAGMGGGSSDCASMLMMLNEMCRLGLSREQLTERAARLGADCPFFIVGRPAYAEGIGERLTPVDLDLSGWWLAVVRPPIPIPTKEAFALVTPAKPEKNCCDIVGLPVENWRELLVNDFERSVFTQHPEIAALKQRLYDMGAVYSAMSGSGSAVFALFRQQVALESVFQGMFAKMVKL